MTLNLLTKRQGLLNDAKIQVRGDKKMIIFGRSSYNRTLLLFVSFLLFILSYSPISMAASNEIKVVINGATQKFETAPIMVNGSVLVPMRAFFEKLGATVNWNSSNKQITATKDFSKIILTVGSNTAQINNSSVKLTSAAQIIKGNTYVPLRFVGEALDADVKWVQETSTVNIKLNNKWQLVNLQGIPNGATVFDWSPDDILTLGSSKGLLQYVSEKWVQFDEKDSPLRGLQIKHIKWSDDGKLAVTAIPMNQEAHEITYLWVWDNGTWSKIDFPKKFGSFMGESIETSVTVDSLWYFGWSPDNFLTLSFGSTIYGANYNGIWQYKDNQWIQLPNSENMGTVNNIVYDTDSWYVLNTNRGVWKYSKGTVVKINTNGLFLDALFKAKNNIYAIGESSGIYKLIDTNWHKNTDSPFDTMSNLQFQSSSVSYSKDSTLLSGSKISSIWFYNQGIWAEIDKNSLPLLSPPKNVPLSESWKNLISEGFEVDSTRTSCSKGKCETTKGKEYYKVSTKFADGAYAENVLLSSSGNKFMLMTYHIQHLYYISPFDGEKEVIDFRETPRQIWIYNNK